LKVASLKESDVYEGEWTEDKANGYGVYSHLMEAGMKDNGFKINKMDM
jgi:hypothetical protein